MATGFLFPGGIVSMPREAVVRLLKQDQGDGALLYLALLVSEPGDSLPNWPPERMEAARKALLELGLLDPEQILQPSVPEKREPEEPPAYNREDVTLALQSSREFPALVEEMQRHLGKILSPTDLQTLLLLCDFLALPAEVILLLTSWCKEKIQKKYGPGRMPTLPQIKTEAFRWQREGIDSLDTAEAYIQKQKKNLQAANRLLPVLGITGREAIAAESRYLEKWSEQGFSDDAVRLAYEKTVLKKQSMNWPYMDSILRSWHQKGFHTAEQVKQGEQGKWKKPTSAGPTAPVGKDVQRARQDMDRLDRFLKKMEEDKKKGE